MVFSNALKATETRSGCFCCRSAYPGLIPHPAASQDSGNGLGYFLSRLRALRSRARDRPSWLPVAFSREDTTEITANLPFTLVPFVLLLPLAACG